MAQAGNFLHSLRPLTVAGAICGLISCVSWCCCMSCKGPAPSGHRICCVFISAGYLASACFPANQLHVHHLVLLDKNHDVVRPSISMHNRHPLVGCSAWASASSICARASNRRQASWSWLKCSSERSATTALLVPASAGLPSSGRSRRASGTQPQRPVPGTGPCLPAGA